MRTFFAYLGLGKIIGVLGVTFIMISYVYIKQQRQYYPIGENLSITIWHEYIIFSHYTSFFPPTSYDEYIYLPSHPKYVHICFIDSADFILYTSNEGNTIVSTKYYNLNKYYCGSGIQYYNFIKYLQQDFFTKEPLCEIELDREESICHILTHLQIVHIIGLHTNILIYLCTKKILLYTICLSKWGLKVSRKK